LLKLRQGAFTCVWWQVTRCDPIWQVNLILADILQRLPSRTTGTVGY